LPDYIFLDVNMPVKDGKQSLVELKKDERLRDIPVIICSTTADKKEIDELYDLGASSFIHKPNNFTDLCSTLNIFVKLAQG
jgi:CheY-like chemotaxis protein